MFDSPSTRRPIGELGVEAHVLQGRGQDAAADVQDVGGFDHGLLETAGDLGESGDEEIAERVAVELRSDAVEAVLEEPGDQGLVVGERDQTVADIAWSGNIVGGADLAGTAAVVGNGHDRGDVEVVPLEAAKQRGEPGAAANGDDVDVRRREAEPMLGDDLDELLVGLDVGEDRRNQPPLKR